MTDGFEIRGVNHLALVCRDMARTVAFYEGVLGKIGRASCRERV